MAGGSKAAVYTAIVGNSVVMVAKFGAFAATGSGAMLSEGIHSLADVLNQSLLAFGIARSERPSDARHPYGYGRAQYVWALISAVGIFFLGCGVAITHGIQGLRHPHELEDPSIALWVLLFAFIVEGGTAVVAFRAVSHQAAHDKLSLWQYLRQGTDPMGIAVLLEDTAAVLGVLIAAACLGLAIVTGDARFDSLGSILIGILLGLIAFFLIDRNRVALLGESAPEATRLHIEELLRNDPVVESVKDVKATVVAVGKLRFKAEVEFDGAELARRWLARQDVAALRASIDSDEALEAFLLRFTDEVVDSLGDEIDRIEASIRESDPRMSHVDLEAD